MEMEGRMQGKAPLSDSNRRIMDADAPPRRVYQAWKGSNIFFLGGRLIFGPDVRSLILTVCLIVIPVILFAAVVSEQLAHEYHNQIGGWVASVAIIFTAYIIVLLLLTSGRDPGIVPRNAHPPEPEDIGESSNLSEWPGGQHGSTSLPLTKDVLVNGVLVKVKYCHTCMLYRPPRCSHCSICNNCVERFDHHCPWVGQCIGKRNYRFFFMFVSSTTILCIYVFTFCWVDLTKIMDTHKCKFGRAIMKSPISGILILYTFVAVWFVGGLTSFHLYLIGTNQTTYENFRYRYDRKTNPHNRGLVQNFSEILFSRIPSSKNNFIAKIKEDSAAFTSSLGIGRALSPPKMSVDLEMGMKRQTVAMEELEDLHSQIGSAMGLERCGTEPPHFVGRKGCSEIATDIEAFAEEFGMEHMYTERKKIEQHTMDNP
ncbi:hypothetical protein GUJ93_ZPchr0008g14102 [Zizania palustris]|uniref:S-acyltransferase n=1 Tax=Zizania palustris TaxID=103762 RepID=A0A8J5RJV4_ZIZPA|nr:hypothetical protein GUJ93_ZPchr0008g14102 [Zizania palustris]KAG8048112.1 hypothetical protein GUJ93_ZPchr0008g14102 [Zizania palustris]